MKRIIILFIFAFIGFNSFASSAAQNADLDSTEIIEAPNNNQKASLETYHLIQEIIQANTSKEDSRTEIIKLRLKTQDEKIKTLEKEIEKLRTPKDDNTSPIILSAVSVIVTALGVLIAILSIFGYSNIKSEAVKSSKETAKATISEVAERGLQEATEASLIILIEEGRFDEIIKNAVANIAYRGISIPDGLTDEEQNP
ncbi:TPA: hypothetical protein ACSPLY_004424 [Pseudomonas aeruginosa]|uniref:hypothetical protein n=1 Tax=Pseudomonas aeruginosa TaxID=287 RepID=UPI000F53BB4A|nr:hypothetical protein [Pseudomonas aeruginosa]MBG4188294.1 hypothetical protein [Pseudomonas aeruginosa]MDV6867915.1 hypothetical protein [Pseudomonas aeruginosa]MDV6885409.1 hypothetical protein [Pseudomonas aeruginosa]NQD48170.1 hypothetical protein [Pseudomonas aeruginosa]RTV09567.1 hypothetical protein DY986_29070 [Pseudomonas aeruginosa]